MTTTKVLITKESLQDLLDNENPEFVMHVVGKALVGLFNRQTNAEQRANSADNNNSIGFAGVDAKSGSLTAKYYLAHRRLEEWMVKNWTRSRADGTARLCKYHRQLNEIALEKQEKKQKG